MLSSRDVFLTPREWVERQGKSDCDGLNERGDHFLEWEEPRIAAADVRQLFQNCVKSVYVVEPKHPQSRNAVTCNLIIIRCCVP